MIIRASDFRFDLPVPADVWHAIADFVEAAPGLLRRWDLRRRTAAELAALTPAQRADIGLEGVSPDEVARRLVR